MNIFFAYTTNFLVTETLLSPTNNAMNIFFSEKINAVKKGAEEFTSPPIKIYSVNENTNKINGNITLIIK